MSYDWVSDIVKMMGRFGFSDAVERMSDEHLREFWDLRLRMLQEEVGEIKEATTAADALDGLVDLAVFAIGTMVLFHCSANEAWDEVLEANMKKVPGVKAGRFNPSGLPDLVKPNGWTPPDLRLLVSPFLSKVVER